MIFQAHLDQGGNNGKAVLILILILKMSLPLLLGISVPNRKSSCPRESRSSHSFEQVLIETAPPVIRTDGAINLNSKIKLDSNPLSRSVTGKFFPSLRLNGSYLTEV